MTKNTKLSLLPLCYYTGASNLPRTKEGKKKEIKYVTQTLKAKGYPSSPFLQSQTSYAAITMIITNKC